MNNVKRDRFLLALRGCLLARQTTATQIGIFEIYLHILSPARVELTNEVRIE